MTRLVVFSLLLCGCAKVGPPSGGGVDRVPPHIVATTPPIDATGVSGGQLITIVFNEEMDRAATRKSVFIAPHTETDFKWRGGRTVEIRPRQGLQPRQTYVVTVGTDAVDRRKNRLEAAYTFAFTTGEKLDSGSISGLVVDDAQPAASAHVWAYDMLRFGGTAGADEPAYQTQTGADGTYEFQRLAPGHYRILAFADRDKDGTFDAGEPVAVPARDVELGDGIAVEAGGLRLSGEPQSELDLVRVQALESRKILLVFNNEVDAGTVVLDVDGLEIGELYGGSDPRRVYATTAEQEGGRSYEIAALAVAGRSLSWREPIRGTDRRDSQRPSIESQTPSGFAAAGDSLRLVFSEAMQPTSVDDSFWIASDSTQVPEGRFSWRHPNELVFHPSRALEAGSYRLSGRLKILADLAGLASADSLVTLVFDVLPETELSRIGGRATAIGVAPIIVQAMRKEGGGGGLSTATDSSGAYSLGGLLPGAYRVVAYQDENGNAAFDRGSLDPFAAAEPTAMYPEIISATRGSSADGVDFELR